MKQSSPVPSWCRSALVVLSLCALTSCATIQPGSLRSAEKPVCDMQKGMCTFSWDIFLVRNPDAPKTDGEHFASGSSVYPVNTFTDVPVEINHGDQDKFALVFNIGSADIPAFSFVTLSGVIHRGKSRTATFSQKIGIRSGGTGEVRVRTGDETFIISVTAPTFTDHSQ
ncbi:hypothetical protein F3X75_20570 [Salmonella enterica subsp. enterica]|nr:hypothetical protein [Salmonella enterica subsp. enterica serovar Newport]ECW2964284.1 hypothetical protein [Salmonella enterica subsp. enterica serovar Oranienburg]ECW3620812.1 hypothetical protein [Salmonella enterica]EDD5412143.1 hypothetical protein [Salmonella enterica subsp. enterica serovar Enteritidis]EGG4280422.1 hypothetical protein [Salmonella enterica]